MNYEIIEGADGKNKFILKEDFSFQMGGVINPLELVYETYGSLNADRDNVILIHHALSTNSHVASHPKNTAPGWWQAMVGSGCAIDTDQYFAICINNLGSCFGSSGPASINPKTNQPYRVDFPTVTVEDIIKSQYILLNDLGIQRLHAVIGNSMGAMMSLSWAIHYPNSLEKLILISSCYKAYPANIANRVVQRETIKLDPAWQEGYYEKNPINGLKIARKLGHFTYRNPSHLNQKFINNEKSHPDEFCEVEDYLEYNATKFSNAFDVNAYLYQLTVMDLFDVTRGYKNKSDAFKKIAAKVLVISVDSDILFLPEQQEELYHELMNAKVNAEIIRHHSEYGHDTFLVEIDDIGGYIKNMLN